MAEGPPTRSRGPTGPQTSSHNIFQQVHLSINALLRNVSIIVHRCGGKVLRPAFCFQTPAAPHKSFQGLELLIVSWAGHAGAKMEMAKIVAVTLGSYSELKIP